MSTCSTSPVLSPVEGYQAWAASYDDESNPMLSLERRILERLLPPLEGLDVVDLGCGTGWWLAAARRARAKSLLGIDPSSEMLAKARARLDKTTKLICGDFRNAAIASRSADVVFCDFVLSYVEDAGQLLKFTHKILRPGGSLILTDVHPETASALKWKRGVRLGSEFQTIRTHDRALEEVTGLCEKALFVEVVHLEPKFGEAERIIFAENGKETYFDEIRDYPAIYIIQLSPAKRSEGPSPREEKLGAVNRVYGGRIALGPEDSFKAELYFKKSHVDRIWSRAVVHSEPSRDAGLDLRDYLVFPGFINAHDHLEFALFPRLGRGGYRNFLEWADDIHDSHAEVIGRHRSVPKYARLWWGGIRNLLCGVTTVCHHNPYDRDVFKDEFVIRVLRDFEWAHSLPLDPKAPVKKRAAHKGRPFFLHLAEGIDASSAEEIVQLHAEGALDDDTVIIHGVAMGPEGRALLRKAGSGLIWCPSSNLFLFGRTITAQEMQTFQNAALGSDSPLTAQGDLLDEVRCAYETMKAAPAQLYEYITRKAANLLRLRGVEGKLRAGGFADLVAVRDKSQTPAETLVSLSYQEVELVIIGGRVQLASTEIKRRLPTSACEGLEPLLIENTVRWIRAPLERLFSEARAHLGEDLYLGGKQIRLGN